MGAIEDLEELQERKKAEDSKRIEIQKYLETRLNKLGKSNILALDSMVLEVADAFMMPEMTAYKLIREIAANEETNIAYDGTEIKWKVRMVACNCGARYSEVLEVCPNCKKREG